jgi:dGTPase
MALRDESLASYASHPQLSRGRLVPEEECAMRSCYQRDRDRILHSAAFRRLEYKTQVFINHEGDHYRTRLTHSLEVAQISRSICRFLKLNEDLGEALALAHDLGHTPFGHAGEDGLQDVMSEYGGFDHNAQTLRILTSLEQRYAAFDGLNLTWELLEGVAKHNGPLLSAGQADAELPRALKEYNRNNDLELYSYAGLEAQVAAIADDIAYNNHDMEDGIRAGLFTLDDLADLPLVGDVIDEVDARYGALEHKRRVNEVIRRIINRLADDVLTQTEENIDASGVETSQDVRDLERSLVHFSPRMQEVHVELKRFLMERMYRHYKVNRMTSKSRRVIKELFTFFHVEPECLPSPWRELSQAGDMTHRAHMVADFVAGMTDRFALDEHKRIFDVWAR